jgi:hypothetical protein
VTVDRSERHADAEENATHDDTTDGETRDDADVQLCIRQRYAKAALRRAPCFCGRARALVCVGRVRSRVTRTVSATCVLAHECVGGVADRAHASDVDLTAATTVPRDLAGRLALQVKVAVYVEWHVGGQLAICCAALPCE